MGYAEILNMGSLPRTLAGILSAIMILAWLDSALAQGTAPASDQSTLFSSPSAGTVVLPGSLPQNTGSRFNSDNAISAPHSVFNQGNFDSSDQMIAPPPPQINSLNQMMNERKKHWAEMTPAEILGVSLPDSDPNAKTSLSDGLYHSPLEKFLLNQHMAQTGTTNLNIPNTARVGWNFLDDNTGLPNPERVDAMRNGNLISSSIFNRLLQNSQPYQSGSQSQNDAWSGVFAAPPTARPTPQQTADMQAFMQLLQPSQASDLNSASALDKGVAPAFSASPLPVVDPNLNPLPPAYNPVGGSFTALERSIGRPNGIAPLPGVNAGFSVPSGPPAWAPKPPPWTLGTPQLFVNPVRKY